MVDEKVSIIVELKDNASKAVKGIQDSFSKLGTTAKVVTAAGIGLITKVIYDCTKAFGEGETATKGLESALRASGQEVKNNAIQMKAFAEKMARATTLEDELVMSVMKNGLAMGLSASKTQEYTQSAIGLSEVTGADLTSAFKMVTAAGQGNYMMMAKAIPTLRGITDQSVLAAKSQELIAAGFQMAKDKTLTFEGSMIQLNKSVNDAQKAIGSTFAPVIQKVAEFIRGLVDTFNELSPTMQKNITIIGTITAVVIALIPVLGVLAAAIAAVSWPVLAVVAAAAALTAGFLVMKNEITAVGGVTNVLKNVFISLAQSWIENIKKMMQAIEMLLEGINKISGGKIDLSVDGAIAELDKLDARLEEKKSKRAADNAAELEETQVQEDAMFAIKTESQLRTEEYEAQIKAAKDEKKLAQIEQDVAWETLSEQQRMAVRQAFQAQNDALALQNDARQKARWQQGFSEWLGIEKMKQTNQQSIGTNMQNFENYMAAATTSKNKEVAGVAKALAIKDITMKTAQAAMGAFNSLSSIPIIGTVLGFAAAAATIAFGAEQIQQVQSTGLAEGGIVMPTPGGTQATIGEAGSAEAVIPLDSPQAQGMIGGGGQNISVNISGKPLAKEMYEIQQEMIRTGEISE